MSPSTHGRAPFGVLLRRTWSAYTRSFGAVTAFSLLYIFVPIAVFIGMSAVIIGAVLSFDRAMPMLGRYGAAFPRLFERFGFLRSSGAFAPLMLSVLPLAMIIVLLLWAVFAIPRYNGAMVVITGNALNGKRTSVGEAHGALRGGRYKQLLVVALCAALIAGSAGVGVNVTSNITNVFTGAHTPGGWTRVFAALTAFASLAALASSVLTALRSLLCALAAPVAIYENKRHFYAVVQSIRYAARRIGVLLGGYALYMLGVFAACALFAVAAAVLSVINAPFLVPVLCLCLFIMLAAFIFTAPLPSIFYTVVYRDIRDGEGYTQFIGTDDRRA